jgi:hypothetical protein
VIIKVCTHATAVRILRAGLYSYFIAASLMVRKGVVYFTDELHNMVILCSAINSGCYLHIAEL